MESRLPGSFFHIYFVLFCFVLNCTFLKNTIAFFVTALALYVLVIE